MKKSRIYLTVCFIILLINSFYLTGLVNRYTITTDLQYFFVVGYFFILCGVTGYYLYNYIKKRLNGNDVKIIKKVLLATFVSILLVSVGGDLFNNHKYQSSTITITATGDKNDQSNSTEVWITGVKINGTNIDLQTLNTKYELGDWQFRDGALLSNSEKPTNISINFPASKEIELSFLKHDWSGIINVVDGLESHQIDLYSQTSGDYVYSLKGNLAPFSYKIIFDYIMAFILCFTIVLAILMLSSIYVYAYSFLYSGIYIFLFILVRIMDIDKVTDLLLIILSFAIGYLFGNMIRLPQIGFNSKGKGIYKLVFLLVAVYVTFAATGTSIFFETGIFDLSLHNISSFLLVCFWILPFVAVFLRFVAILEKDVFLRESNSQWLQLWFLLFFIQLISGLVYLVAYYPANMSPDSIDQWAQAMGTEPMSDWHPAFHTFINMIILSIYNSPAAIALFQIIFSAVIVSSFLTLLHRNGLPRKWIIAFVIIFSLLPNNGVNLVTLWKDIPFTISLLWLTLSLARIKLFGDKALTFLNHLSLIGALVCVSLFRHNGIVPFAFTVLFLLIIGLRNKNYKVLVSILSSIILIFVIKGSIDSHYNVIPNPDGLKLVAPIHGVASVINYGGSLTNESQDLMKELMPIEEWKRLYDPYTANSYMFDNEYNLVNKLSNYDTINILKIYLDTLYRNPSLVVNDRLAGINLIWDITQPELAYNNRFSNIVMENDLGIERKDNFMTKLMDSILILSYKYKILDSVLWRGGIYSVICVILLLTIVMRKRWSDLPIWIPFLGNILSLLLSMSWQDYRYVYFEFYTIWFIIGTILCAGNQNPKIRELKGK